MAQNNSIPLLGFQGESPADNYLSAYSKSQQQAQGNELHQRRIGAMDMQAEQDKLAMVADALVNVPDGDAAGFERVKQGLVARKIIDPETAAQYDVSALPQIKAASEKWRAMQKFNMEQQQGAQRSRLTEAQIAATNRSNRGGGAGGGMPAAPSGYQWVRGPDGSLQQAPIKGGPAEAQRLKMNDEQAKALGFAKRIGDANAILEDPGFEQALLSGKENIASSIPFVGNALVSESYQMADQAVRDFINAQLRRESGAVIAESEFANARAQYIPVYGDKPEVLARKRLARQRALENLYVSSGPNNYGTAETVAQGLPGTPQPGAAASATNIPRVSTKAQFDALPSGSVYMEDDGKRYTKP